MPTPDEHLLAKFVASCKRDIARLERESDELGKLIRKADQNSGSHNGSVTQIAFEIGREVQFARDMGAKGNRLADFSDAPKVKAAYREYDSLGPAIKATAKEIRSGVADAKAALAGAKDLRAAVEKEIEVQEKAAKVAKRPAPRNVYDLADLLKELRKLSNGLVEALSVLEGYGDYAAQIDAKFEKAVKAEYAKTRENRDAQEQQELLQQSLNPRTLAKAEKLAKKLADEVEGAVAIFSMADLAEDADEMKKAYPAAVKESKAALGRLEDVHAEIKDKVDRLEGFGKTQFRGSEAERTWRQIDEYMTDSEKRVKDLLRKKP